jgi:hypothetical protein
MNIIEIQLSLLPVDWTIGTLFGLLFSWPIEIPNFYMNLYMYNHNLFDYIYNTCGVPWSRTQDYIMIWCVIIALPIYGTVISWIIRLGVKVIEEA